MKNLINILIIAIILIIFLVPTCYAEGAADKAISDGDAFINKANELPIELNNLIQGSKDINNILILLGMIIAVIVGSILGIKLMISSSEDKAKAKQMLTVYLVGCVVLFGAYTIWRICIGIFEGI